jgi:ubiquinone biosynthesis protein UbiJ
MPAEFVQLIRAVNGELRGFFHSAGTADSSDTALGSEQIERLTKRLEQVGEQLGRALPSAQQTAEGRAEMAQYARNLKKLRSAVETFQSSLLVQRSQLQTDQKHLQAASAWATSYKEIG